MTTFTVDTHLFRELGDLLVGRDSTALVELVKNAYDADATYVIVSGDQLNNSDVSTIRISDDGVGMSRAAFENGFLRIASRLKDEGERRSPRFERRYTGAKGVGRLAAHKLARFIEIETTAKASEPSKSFQSIRASIDWDLVEQAQTLDRVGQTNAIVVTTTPTRAKSTGTTISLRRLRRRWTVSAHARFLEELQSFVPPPALTEPLPKGLLEGKLLFSKPIVRDARRPAGGDFRVQLEGDLAPPDDYWHAAVAAADWVIEIDANERTRKVRYAIAPTARTREHTPLAELVTFTIDHPEPKTGPFFQSRILVRVGPPRGKRDEGEREWRARSTGVRVYMEGFRVLPYGEKENDWLALDRDVTNRDRGLLTRRMADSPLASLLANDDEAEQEGLLHLPSKHYVGAVFLTHAGAPDLRMLVNREGFIPEGGYDTLVQLVRAGIDLATRTRAHATAPDRARKRALRAQHASALDRIDSPAAGDSSQSESGELLTVGNLRTTLAKAVVAAREGRELVAAGRVVDAISRVEAAVQAVEEVREITEDLTSEAAMLRILASVGTQLAAFVHEINSVLGMAKALETGLGKVRSETHLPRALKRSVVELHVASTELRRHVERQASFLIDVISPEASRRRARLPLAERFERAKRLVERSAIDRGIEISERIPDDLKTPPMFAAEITTVFSNLLTNAVKAAGNQGRIRATAKRTSDGRIVFRLENTGVAVLPDEGERWFQPFASTTARVDTTLGHGMGLGLTITRYILDEYGASIAFVRPGSGFQTAIEITFPSR